MYNKIDEHFIVAEEPTHCPDDDVFSSTTPAWEWRLRRYWQDVDVPYKPNPLFSNYDRKSYDRNS